MLTNAPPLLLDAIGLAVLVAAAVAARYVSRWAGWAPAGPIALIAAAPLVPRLPLLFSLTLDDLAPLLGLGLLLLQLPVPRLTNDRLLRVVLVAVILATMARIASALVNGDGVEGSLIMLVKGIARPALLVGIVAYAAIAMPAELRRRVASASIAAVGTLEAAFGLLAFAVPLPGGAGIEAARRLTTLYGTCPGRISGTLGLSPNHVGAVFVICLPLTVAQAVRSEGRARWAWAAAGALQLAALILTFTRSSIILGAAATAAFLILQRRFVLLGLVAGLALAIAFAILSLGCTTSSGGHGLPSNPVSLIGGRFTDSNDRMALWYAAARIMLDHPVAGVGLGKMDDTLAHHPEYRGTPFGTATSSAHNTILLAGAETGIAGALAALVINVGLGLAALRIAWWGAMRRDPLVLAAALAILAYLVQGMVNNLFEVGATSALFALAVGVFAVPGRADGEPAGAAASPSA